MTAARIRDGIARRLHGPYSRLDRIDERVSLLGERIDHLESRLSVQSRSLMDEWAASLRTVRGEVHDALRALGAREGENRSLLRSVRGQPSYERAWTRDRPLISVTVATLGRPELISRSLPSILGQSHDELEVVVAADGAAPEIEAEVQALGDSRIRYLALGSRQTWTDDPVKLWLVGATRARNAALEATRGHWIVDFDDDDAMRPGCLQALLETARETRAEAVYGQIRHGDGAERRDIGAFPPRLGQFSWAAGMYHAGLRFFGRELLAADLGLPGDWWLAERMLRAGVRFALREEVLCDVFPSQRAADAISSGAIPWSVDLDPTSERS